MAKVPGQKHQPFLFLIKNNQYLYSADRKQDGQRHLCSFLSGMAEKAA